MLDARIASDVNKDHPEFLQVLRGRQIAYMIYDDFRVTGAHDYDSVLDYADLFTITLRDDDVQEFDTI